MNPVFVTLKLLHILSAGILFGAGMAIAFFMLMAWRSGDRAGFALTARHVVLADWVFTTTAVIVQPVSGVALAHWAGWPLTSPWLLATYALYVFIGACWLPVVWIQIQVKRELASHDGTCDGGTGINGTGLPERVHRLMRYWFILGWPAFTALIAIFVLMIAKPTLV